MSRQNTGTVAWRRHPKKPGTYCWQARYTRGDKTRTPWALLDPSIPEHDEEAARKCALTFAPAAKAATKDGVGELVASYSIRWLAERKTRVVSVKDDTSRLRDHVLPLIGHLSVLSMTRDDVEGVRDALDDKVAQGAIGWKTARHAWQITKSMCGDMANARRRELRVRDDDPSAGIKPTLRGVSRSKQFLYPSEFLKFMACDKIPREWRVAVALAIFTYGRDGEVAVLDWSKVDLEHGILTIDRARNRDTGEAKSTKTGGRAVQHRAEPRPHAPGHARCGGGRW